MGILNVPVQINGNYDSSSTPSSLLPRELFINNKFNLFVGNKDNEVEAINITGKSSSTDRITNNINFDLKAYDTDFQIGYLNFTNATKTFNSPTLGQVSISQVNLNNIPKIILSNISGNQIYGSESNRPLTGVQGQLYFQFAD